MGDRLLMQVKGPADEFSPVIYCHWSGSEAPRICEELRERMWTQELAPGEVVEVPTHRETYAQCAGRTGQFNVNRQVRRVS